MTKAIESCIEEAVKRGAVSETYGGGAGPARRRHVEG